MKTTVKLPEALFRRAKSMAAQEGVTLKQLLSRDTHFDKVKNIERVGWS